MRFVDTNIILYSVSTHPDERAKAAIARATLEDPNLALSVQVLQEFYAQATRPSSFNPLSHREAIEVIDMLRGLPIQPVTIDVFNAATATKQRYQISYWDAAIIEAARFLGCDTILSEDLTHGQSFGGVRVENPFL